MQNLVWFRSDLRILDNRALRAAREGDYLACILPPVAQLLDYGQGMRKIGLLREAAQRLQADLEAQGIEVIYREVDSFQQQIDSLVQLCREKRVAQIYWNNEYPLDERRRDQKLAATLERQGISVSRFDDSLILRPDEIATQEGSYYQVFTPFKRAWMQIFARQQNALCARLDARPEASTNVLLALDNFADNQLHNYHNQRDYPAVRGTSRLSAALSLGTLSPMRALAAALSANRGELAEGDPGVTAWISQLIWREFYYHLIAQCDRLSQHQPFQAHTGALRWNNPGENFQRWKQGLTGVPIIDAGMRQLAQTGWMHNRVRMITAMFLSKNLLIDWRLGEKYFLQQLADGDFALNNGGWQWSASTGTDAAPYFRVFNPYTQAQRFDPDAHYIKAFVPELRQLPANIIHNETRLGQQRPSTYPAAIVDSKVSRKAAIAAFRHLQRALN